MYEILLSILVSQREGLRNRSFYSNLNRNLSQEDIDLLMNLTVNTSFLDREFGAGDCQQIWDRLPDDPVDLVGVRLIFGFLYATIWLVSVCGNLSILYLSMVRRLKLTVKTTFIVILACSDLSITLTSLPVTAASIFTHVWLFGSFMCSSIGFFQGMAIL
uniref:G-protein coupled receptors family 1 profile domain-containing protein n=1 Tax=Romanomermis culicivorax TaxID=13658 RepID=A0A915I871_ROMCU